MQAVPLSRGVLRFVSFAVLLVAARGTARVMADVGFVLVPLWNLNVGMKPVFTDSLVEQPVFPI
jgi:hypothetical protein